MKVDIVHTLSRRSALIGGVAAAAMPAFASISQHRRTRFGINFNRLFLGQLNGDLATANVGLAALGKAGVPFVRFAAAGQWAGDWKKFDENPSAYWTIMDGIFAQAERSGVQLVPSVLWHTVALSMFCGEAMSAWVDPASKTRQAADRYVNTFVERYDRSPALLMYEFTNELNDWIDLPASVLNLYWPKPDPTLPTRKPLPQDRLSGSDLLLMATDFAQILRRRSVRPIGMGSNRPRDNAWHLQHGQPGKDDGEQFFDQLRDITPAQMNVLSVHVYAKDYGSPGSVFPDLVTLLTAFVEAARKDRRIAFVGEFGISRMSDRVREQASFADMANAIASAGVDYAAVWNFAPNNFQPDWAVNVDGDRFYQIEDIVKLNRG